jgi:hypothetical protein
VWRVQAVDSVSYSTEAAYLHIWILLRHDAIADLERIFLLEREFGSMAGPAPMEIHVYARDKIDVSSLPAVSPLFQRG